MDGSFDFISADLAPGDRRSLALDHSALNIERIHSAEAPAFEEAYAMLWAEFGPIHELEDRAVLARRLQQTAGGGERRYELLVIRSADGSVAAVRDHQAIRCEGEVVVHLSHALIRPDFRRTGLAGWLRALPLQTARRCANGENLRITLAGEMEHPDAAHPHRMIRLLAYEKAGFRKIDPTAFEYLQPDFRPPSEIDASGGPQPLPFGLVLRRVDREAETEIRGGELRMTVGALYRIYDADFRPQDMRPLWDYLDAKGPSDDARIALGPPTSGPLSR